VALYTVGSAYPIQIVFTANKIVSQTIYNRDPTNSLQIGFEVDRQVPDFTNPLQTDLIDPLGSITVDGTQNCWAQALSAGGLPTTLTVDVYATGTSQAGSALTVAGAITSSGLALQIAQQIAATGVSLLPAPSPIYQYGLTAGPSTTLVGITVPSSAFNGTGCYASVYNTQTAADAALMAFVFPTGPSVPTVTKKFWNLSDWSQTKNNMPAYSAAGTRVVVCLKPAVTSGLPLGSNFTTTGTTAQKAAAAADHASLITFLAWLASIGFKSTNCDMIFWQEPGNSQNLGGAGAQGPIDYSNMLLTYGGAVNSSSAADGQPFPLGINVNFTGNVTNATNYANAAFGLRAYAPGPGVTITYVAMDWYTNSYGGGNYLYSTDSNNDSIMSITQGQGLPFALNEFGCNPSGAPTGTQVSITTATQYMAPTSAGGDAVNGLFAQLGKWLNAGNTIRQLIYYEGVCSAAGTGDITNPVGACTNPGVGTGASDFRVPFYKAIDTTFASGALGGTTLNSTHTTVLVPISPSPVGNLAPLDTLSYELVLGLTAGAGSTNPWCTVIIQFFDFDVIGANQVVVDQVNFACPMGTSGDANGPAVTAIHGPARGGFMILKIDNLDSVNGTLEYLQLAGVGRSYDRHTARWDVNSGSSPAIPGYTLANAGAASLQIGRIAGQSILHGASKTFLNGLAPGQVFLRIYAQGASSVNFVLQPQPTSVYGTENLINENVGTGSGLSQELLFTIALPRAPCIMTITNNDGANTATVDYQLIAIET
jgi:hypothetical protein